MPTVLVIDDEANIRDLVGVYLTSAGFEVATAADGNAGLQAFNDRPADLVVLDIMLPGLTGPELLAKLRETSDVPVIMLTARESDLDKVTLLEGGADDYVTKPFSPPELVARVRALLRRRDGARPAAGKLSARIVLGGLEIDPATREVTVDGAPVVLTAREFDFVAAMAEEPGVVFSRERLLERAVGYAEFVDSRGVDVHVRHIREKLGDDAADPRFIETVRGVGYRVRKDAR
ncbi:MAG: response regulator transcription factor [Actinomycetota bacterium]|nr:response regulator transcription factor [Actinomycetota bacterium]